jgi:hypothetical protein
MIAARPEFLRRRLEQFAHRLAPPLGARRLFGGNCSLAQFVHVHPSHANLNRLSTKCKFAQY